jgi:acyl-CoA synthetase (AMP-forming)/AMP-acid ligase II
MNITSRLDHFAELHPDKPAFIFFQDGDWRTVTYIQLADSTERFVSGLLACGVVPGMTATLLTPPSVDFFALAFALLKVGVVPIILDPAIGLKKVGECLDEAKPDIFIGNTLTHFLRRILGWGKGSVKYSLTIEFVRRLTFNVQPVTTSNLPEAAVIYTSGSTGIPKGVVFTHENLSAQLDMLVETFGITPDEIDLPAFPLYALIDVLLGVTSVIPDIAFPVPGKTDPAKVIQAIQRFGVTNMFASPVVLDILSSFALSEGAIVAPQSKGTLRLRTSQGTLSSLLRAKLPSLKRVITAGAPATIQLQQDFRKLLNDETDLFGIYGATEVLPIAKVESREVFALREKSAKGAGVCLGKPVDGAKVRVIGISDSAIQRWEDKLEVKPNIVGEITVQGGAVTERYIVREAANRLSKIQHEDGIIHRMGDVGYFDDEGRLWYCGRKSHRVVTKDDELFTEQIEGIFNIHPLVYRTALVGVEGEPILWVELQKGVRTNKDTIKRELLELAKDHPQASKIKDFLFMKKFPTDVRHNSKIIREELAKKALQKIHPSHLPSTTSAG